MKVLFLDFDGVLNARPQWPPYASIPRKADRATYLAWCADTMLDPAMCARVERVCCETGARVVVSSSWRFEHTLPELRWMLTRVGFDASLVVGKIGREGEGRRSRGEAIRQWLSYRPEVTRHAVVDDRAIEQGITGDCVVRTNADVGITDHDAERAIAILRGAVALVGWDANGAPETSFPEEIAPMFGALPTNVGPAASQPPGAVIDRLGGTTDG